MLGIDDEGRRADRIVRKLLRKYPLSFIYRLFREKKVLVDGSAVQPDDRCRSGQKLIILTEIAKVQSSAEHMPLRQQSRDEQKVEDPPRIIWESDHLVAVHKPWGMLTHDGPHSLDSFVSNLLRDALAPSVSFRPGPLHRLDRNTSGIVMFSKSRIGADSFSKALRERKIGKLYLAVVRGAVHDEQHFDDLLVRDHVQRRSTVLQHAEPPIRPQHEQVRKASMHMFRLATSGAMSLVAVDLQSGLTHQIRVQMAAHGLPLAGDAKYGGGSPPPGLRRYLLHAYSLIFKEEMTCVDRLLIEDEPEKLILDWIFDCFDIDREMLRKRMYELAKTIARQVHD